MLTCSTKLLSEKMETGKWILAGAFGLRAGKKNQKFAAAGREHRGAETETGVNQEQKKWELHIDTVSEWKARPGKGTVTGDKNKNGSWVETPVE
jgi:hypothetical protein